MRISDGSSDVCSSDLCCDATTLAQLGTDLGRDGVVALIDELIAAAPDDVKALREAHEAAASMPAAQTLAVSSRLLGAEALARDLMTPETAAHREVLAGRYEQLLESLRAWRGRASSTARKSAGEGKRG